MSLSIPPSLNRPRSLPPVPLWPVGARWFRHAGGMPPISLDEPSGRYLSFAEREEIALLRAVNAASIVDLAQIS